MKPVKPRSKLQNVCMQYGKDCRDIANSYRLTKFLLENGQADLANNITIAISRARRIARDNYFKSRKELQPEWKDWNEVHEEVIQECLTS